MRQALLRRSLLVLVVAAAVFGGQAAYAQSFDPNIVSRVDSFIPPPQQTVLPTKTQKVPVKKTEEVTVTVTETKDLTLEEREAKANQMGITVPLGLRSPTARRAYLDMRGVPNQVVSHVSKRKSRIVTTIIEKTEPRKIVVRGAAAGGYNYASNANQTSIDIIADSINSENANLLVLIPAGRTEDTVSLLFGSTGTRYAGLNSSSFDALNGSVIYTRLLARKQMMEGLNTGGTAVTDILTIGLDGTAVYEPGFGAEQISIATPSIGWSRSNIGLGNSLCGEKGAESYCYYADIAFSLGESIADVQSQTNSWLEVDTTIGWHPPVKNLSLWATGSIQGAVYSDYPGGRQDLIFTGTGNFSWLWKPNVTLGAGVKFTQQISSHPDLDWNGVNVIPRVLFNMKFYQEWLQAETTTLFIPFPTRPMLFA